MTATLGKRASSSKTNSTVAHSNGVLSTEAHSIATHPDMPKSNSADKTKKTGRNNKAFWVVLALTLGAITWAVLLINWNNPMPLGSDGYFRILKMRSVALVAMVLVALAQAAATVTFHTVTSNRILTPSIMGAEAIYVTIATALVFFLGASGVKYLAGPVAFITQVALMVTFSTLLFLWLLRSKAVDLTVMLLVGIVLGGGLRALSSFMQRLLNPSDFDVLSAKMFGNISQAKVENFVIVIPLMVLCWAYLIWQAPTLNVLTLGRDTAISLGVNYNRAVVGFLIVVALLTALSTALVGPMTFLGFLMAMLAYQVANNVNHRLLLPVSALIGFNILAGSYFILKNIFYAEGAVTVIIELVGGTAFLVMLLRRGRF